MASQERSKPLHNFSLPCLKWGHRRLLRCVKIGDDQHQQQQQQEQEIRSSSHSIQDRIQSKPIDSNTSKIPKGNPIVQETGSVADTTRFAELGAKRLKLSSSPVREQRDNRSSHFNNEDSSSRPWNLRTRRAACKSASVAQVDEGGGNNNNNNNGGEADHVKGSNDMSLLVLKRQCYLEKKEKKRRVKFSISLSKVEIEQDFFQMIRIRPPRRPKKRTRIVQKYMDTIFPGLWLTEVTVDMYKVPEEPES